MGESRDVQIVDDWQQLMHFSITSAQVFSEGATAGPDPHITADQGPQSSAK